jgi:hypothetical protein
MFDNGSFPPDYFSSSPYCKGVQEGMALLSASRADELIKKPTLMSPPGEGVKAR